jgi:hypothetical protein
MQGRSVDEDRAPLFVARQLTSRCGARRITCCEESRPDRAWRDELGRDEALEFARRIGAFEAGQRESPEKVAAQARPSPGFTR